MQKLLFILQVSLTTIMATLFTSCGNDAHDMVNNDFSVSENLLIEYGNIHNDALNFIKSEGPNRSQSLTQNRVDSTFNVWVETRYENQEIYYIFSQIKPLKEILSCGDPSRILPTRGDEADFLSDHANDFALDALKECLFKISQYMNNIDDVDIFDNQNILDELHQIIIETNNDYLSKCYSDIDKDALVKSLGVLYGSIEYWTNYDNVLFWTNVESELPMTRADNKNEPAQKNDQTLSKKDWIQTVSAADAAGAVLGSGVASVPAGAILSAMAALYFDVE